MSSLLRDNNDNFSTQRVSLIGALIGIMYLILVVGIYILKRGGSEAGIGETEWFGLAAFIGAMLTGLGVNAGVKAWQKKYEEKSS